MGQNLTKVTLKDSSTSSSLSPKSMASSVIFNDGESLQFKYDNGTLLKDGILGGIQAVSPTVEIYENQENVSYKLKIKDINGYIITPNLIGPKGSSGDSGNSGGNGCNCNCGGTDSSTKTTLTYEHQFVSNDMQQINGNTYLLRINRTDHKLGFGAKVVEILRYLNDTELVNVTYSYKRLVNGDIILVFNEAFAGIIYLQGEN